MKLRIVKITKGLDSYFEVQRMFLFMWFRYGSYYYYYDSAYGEMKRLQNKTVTQVVYPIDENKYTVRKDDL